MKFRLNIGARIKEALIDFHTQGKPQLFEFSFYFVEGFFSEISIFEHFLLTFHGQLAHRRDIGVV